MIYKYIKEAIKLRKLNHQLSKDKLKVLSKLLNNKKFKQNKLNSLEITETFKFVYGHYYPLATIKMLLTYEESFKAFQFYKLGSNFIIDDNKGNLKLNEDNIKITKQYAWFCIVICSIFIMILISSILIFNITLLGISSIVILFSFIILSMYNLDGIFFANLFFKEYLE